DDWGPRFWSVMHSVAFWYDDEPTPAKQKAAYDFYVSLTQLLPCNGCREHYAQLLQTYPVDVAVASRMALLQWTVDIHNLVNESIGKEVLSLER
ncbi:ERV/ALR sulfhydryl oxidase domain-containing protein, partial [Pavlovales sp. CCMP2436]